MAVFPAFFELAFSPKSFQGKTNHLMSRTLTDKEIILRLAKKKTGKRRGEWLPALHYTIHLPGSEVVIGNIDLRLGYSTHVVRYGGHIGYGINPQWRGNHYAGKACKLLKAVAIEHGMDVIWITCNPENLASRKTCEWLGLELVEIVDVPPDNELYKRGEKRKCRFRWILF